MTRKEVRTFLAETDGILAHQLAEAKTYVALRRLVTLRAIIARQAVLLQRYRRHVAQVDATPRATRRRLEQP